MNFPFYLHVFGGTIHPHLAFETLAYFVGARFFFHARKIAQPPSIGIETQLWLLVGCIFGAWMGSKLLAWAEMPEYYWSLRLHPVQLLGGKTIVGGLLGGWAGVEFVKQLRSTPHSTGDAFVPALIAGTAIGRIGCFLTGLTDHTYGLATELPWGVDFGDRIHRHPTQLYESLFVAVFGFWLLRWAKSRVWPSGALFRLYLLGYLSFRLTVEFIKPREILAAGLSAIQLACVAGILISLWSLRRLPPANRCPSFLLHGRPDLSLRRTD